MYSHSAILILNEEIYQIIYHTNPDMRRSAAGQVYREYIPSTFVLIKYCKYIKFIFLYGVCSLIGVCVKHDCETIIRCVFSNNNVPPHI